MCGVVAHQHRVTLHRLPVEELGAQVDPVEALRCLEPGHANQRRHVIERRLQRVGARCRRHVSRPADEHGYLHSLVVGHHLVAASVASEHLAVIGGEHDDRVFGQSRCVEIVEDAPHIVVGILRHRVIRARFGQVLAGLHRGRHVVVPRERLGHLFEITIGQSIPRWVRRMGRDHDEERLVRTTRLLHVVDRHVGQSI